MYFSVTQSPYGTNESGKIASFNVTQASLGSMMVMSKRSFSAVVRCNPNEQTPGLYETQRIICSVRNADTEGVGTVVVAAI